MMYDWFNHYRISKFFYKNEIMVKEEDGKIWMSVNE
jgi:hypothetical protein